MKYAIYLYPKTIFIPITNYFWDPLILSIECKNPSRESYSAFWQKNKLFIRPFSFKTNKYGCPDSSAGIISKVEIFTNSTFLQLIAGMLSL